MLMPSAGIGASNNEGIGDRYFGRGGLGAVMGSKGLKAIVIDAPKNFDVPVKDKERFRAAAKKLPRSCWTTRFAARACLLTAPTS